MQQTPKGNQLHIGLFGKRNAGKSTLMNRLLGQDLSIVSPIAGTTTDIVHKSKEWHPLGPVIFVDTPGLDDEGELGKLRVQKAFETLQQIDLVLWVSQEPELEEAAKQILEKLKGRDIPYIMVYNIHEEHHEWLQEQEEKKEESLAYIPINAQNGQGMEQLKRAITQTLSQKNEKKCIGDKVQVGEVIMLVMPQDLQAPKGRLILPQVQILRELLDAHAIPILTTKETLKETLAALHKPPSLMITDSQIFKEVYEICPNGVRLTSFSILMARQKGDLNQYIEGARAISRLKKGDHILIAESCTHNPLHGDIARHKIPRAITKKITEGVVFENICGNSFPEDLAKYSLIIQCGGCMHTPRQVQARIEKAQATQCPITNFGVALAYLAGILEKIWIPS